MGGKRGCAAMRHVDTVSRGHYRRFAYDHLGLSAHIISDGLPSVAAGPSRYKGHGPVPPMDAEDRPAMPVVHHLISNFKAMVIGTYRGATKRHLQSYMDELTYRYTSRNRKARFHLLMGDLCRSKPYRDRTRMVGMFPVQEPLPMAA